MDDQDDKKDARLFRQLDDIFLDRRRSVNPHTIRCEPCEGPLPHACAEFIIYRRQTASGLMFVDQYPCTCPDCQGSDTQ